MRIIGWDDRVEMLTGLTTLTKGEPCSDLSSGLVDEIANHLDVVTGHDHLLSSVWSTLWPVEANSDIGRAQEELRAVVVHERCVSTTLLLSEDLRMRNVSTRITPDRTRDCSRRFEPGTC